MSHVRIEYIFCVIAIVIAVLVPVYVYCVMRDNMYRRINKNIVELAANFNTWIAERTAAWKECIDNGDEEGAKHWQIVIETLTEVRDSCCCGMQENNGVQHDR